jgi:ATP-dependent DNA helicase RecQ
LLKQLIHGRQYYSVTDKAGRPDLSRYDIQLSLKTNELNHIIAYAKERNHCLMHSLTQVLGDTSDYHCGHCDNCSPSTLVAEKMAMHDNKEWLTTRAVSIHLGRLANVAEGVAVLNGQMRSAIFIEFMRNRSVAEMPVSQVLLDAIENHLKKLQQQHQFTAVITLPSRTWVDRIDLTHFIADILKVPGFFNELTWQTVPEQRQGELLNNDQRRFNVDKKMQFNSVRALPAGTLLLLDDYTGSGATLKEASRTLKKHISRNSTIVPFTIAAVRWRLGKRGMI